MAAETTTVRGVVPGTKLSVGSLIMAIGGAGFIGYGVLFFFRNFGSFLELGIGRGQIGFDETAELADLGDVPAKWLDHLVGHRDKHRSL